MRLLVLTRHSGNVHSGFFFKQKNKLKEQKTAMKNKDGELVETEKEVKEVYTEFYKDILRQTTM